jgi:hypothetical protein
MSPRALLLTGLTTVTALSALTACAPTTLRARVNGQEIIKEFAVAPNKAKIKLNEYVKFSFTLSKPGFVTLFTTDPDRTTYELDRNVPVITGKAELPSKTDVNASGKAAYQISEPLGRQLVYLAFTEKAIPVDVKFKGVLNEANLENRIREALEKSGGGRDIASLEFEVVK